jgi:putative redox protein
MVDSREELMGRAVTVEIEQTGKITSKATARSHTVFVDRPSEKGGDDRGPLGGELLLISLGGCFMSTLLAAVVARSADVSQVRVTVTGTIGGAPERYEAMTLRVAAKYHDADLMRKLLEVAERGCLVTNTLRSGVALTVELSD